MFEQIKFFKADWNTIVQEIIASNLSNSIQHLHTEDALNLFVKTIGDICIKNAPLKKSKKTSISSFFKLQKALMRKRRKLKMCFSKQGVSRRAKIKDQLINIELQLLKSHNDEQTHDENLAIDRIKSDPNYFFKYAKKFSKTGTEVGPLQDSHGDLVNDKKLMSDLLLNLFSGVFSTPSANHVISDVTSFFYDDEHSNLNLKPKLTTINFTKEHVESAIKSLKINSAPGPDGMTGELLTNCVSVISEPLAALFTKSLTEGSVPTLLKRAAVVPIYKGGDRSLPSNYRPVSLTPILMKVMEKIVRGNIVTFLTENNLFNPSQHGFMKGRSCLSALLSVYDELINNLSNCQPSCIDMIYLDFAKAFDKVDHGVLLHKLKSMGITGDLGNWLLNFLSDRKHFVRMPGGISNDSPVLSGVPQGTVLDPLLFLVTISNTRATFAYHSFCDNLRLHVPLRYFLIVCYCFCTILNYYFPRKK